jgi:hypothetical protein
MTSFSETLLTISPEPIFVSRQILRLPPCFSPPAVFFSARLQMKDYRLVLGLKRTWIVALIVGTIQLIAWTFNRS